MEINGNTIKSNSISSFARLVDLFSIFFILFSIFKGTFQGAIIFVLWEKYVWASLQQSCFRNIETNSTKIIAMNKTKHREMEMERGIEITKESESITENVKTIKLNDYDSLPSKERKRET